MDRYELRHALVEIINVVVKTTKGLAADSGCYTPEEIEQAWKMESSNKLSSFFASLNEAAKIAKEI